MGAPVSAKYGLNAIRRPDPALRKLPLPFAIKDWATFFDDFLNPGLIPGSYRAVPASTGTASIGSVSGGGGTLGLNTAATANDTIYVSPHAASAGADKTFFSQSTVALSAFPDFVISVRVMPNTALTTGGGFIGITNSAGVADVTSSTEGLGFYRASGATSAWTCRSIVNSTVRSSTMAVPVNGTFNVLSLHYRGADQTVYPFMDGVSYPSINLSGLSLAGATAYLLSLQAKTAASGGGVTTLVMDWIAVGWKISR